MIDSTVTYNCAILLCQCSGMDCPCKDIKYNGDRDIAEDLAQFFKMMTSSNATKFYDNLVAHKKCMYPKGGNVLMHICWGLLQGYLKSRVD